MGVSCIPGEWADGEVITERETLCVKGLAETKAGRRTGKGQKETESGEAKQLQGARSKEVGHWGYRVSSSQGLMRPRRGHSDGLTQCSSLLPAAVMNTMTNSNLERMGFLTYMS